MPPARAALARAAEAHVRELAADPPAAGVRAFHADAAGVGCLIQAWPLGGRLPTALTRPQGREACRADILVALRQRGRAMTARSIHKALAAGTGWGRSRRR